MTTTKAMKAMQAKKAIKAMKAMKAANVMNAMGSKKEKAEQEVMVPSPVTVKAANALQHGRVQCMSCKKKLPRRDMNIQFWGNSVFTRFCNSCTA